MSDTDSIARWEMLNYGTKGFKLKYFDENYDAQVETTSESYIIVKILYIMALTCIVDCTLYREQNDHVKMIIIKHLSMLGTDVLCCHSVSIIRIYGAAAGFISR